MAKQKTPKTFAKRVWITKSGKVRKRKAGQDHFNTRESGNTVRNKRRDDCFAKPVAKNLKRILN